MAKEAAVWEVIKNAGYEPIENKSIIVSYAPANLSDAIVKFFGADHQYFVLQICRDELVLVPFGVFSMGLKKEVTLSIPFSEIEGMEIEEKGLNYYLTIRSKDDRITLSIQQKELSSLRTSGFLGTTMLGGNWHSRNMDGTMKMLKEIPAGAAGLN